MLMTIKGQKKKNNQMKPGDLENKQERNLWPPAGGGGDYA
uniref:Uncharacterized protein n=1 Tax=Rhizophora mucronata TaxID=61149 RepID=A0A2P2NRY5_RHIMU